MTRFLDCVLNRTAFKTTDCQRSVERLAFMGTVVMCVDLLSQAKDIETAEYRQHGKRVLKQYINNTYIYFVSILTTPLETSNLSCFSGGYYVQAFSCGDRLRQLKMKQETCTGLHVNRLDNFFQIINVRTIILIQHYTDDENSAQTNHCECLSSLCYRPISTKYSVCMS